jgi:putative copper export protein
MTMMNWLGVVTSGLWVLGLAGMLAALSYLDYYAKTRGRPLHQVLNAPRFLRPFSWAGVIFCVGVAVSGESWWQRVTWAVLAALFAVQAWQSREPVESR